MFSPDIAVALNLEMDHVDYYKDEKTLKNSFVKALSLASGFVLLNEDDENLFKIEKRIASRVITFSANRNSDYHYEILSFAPGGYSFSIKKMGKTLGIFRLPILGAFNVTNAAAAAIVAIECGIPTPIIAEALKSFGGVKRRLEHIGTHHGRHLIYDYAHHPTEIRASINTIRMAYPGEITVIFKPHTFTRTEYFWRDFIGALQLADHVVVTDIYPARERPIAGVSSEKLAQAIGPRAIYSKENELLSAIDLHTYGTIILMGAGDLDDIKNKLLRTEQDDCSN
jgi:UDP-N-acetylmuramate--alanine ligase